MIVRIILGGFVYDISDMVDYRHLSNVGLGMPPVQLYQEQGPLQHGATYIDYRLQPRDITLIIGAVASNFTQYMARRNELLLLLRSKSRTKTYLELEFSPTEIYRTEVVYVEGLGFDGNDKSGFYHKHAIVLRAYDPTWFNPTLNTVVISGNVSMHREVPTSIPLRIGTRGFNEIVNITYLGTYDSFPVMRIVGPLTYFYIRNIITQDYIELETSVDDFTSVTIDTNYGQKTILDQDGNSLIQYYNGDLATFRILAAESAGDTVVNSFDVQVDGATDDTKIFFQYYTRYIGV